MVQLKFYDFLGKKSFTTNKFTLKKTKKGCQFAVVKAPSGIKAYRFVGKNFKK